MILLYMTIANKKDIFTFQKIINFHLFEDIFMELLQI